jgi:hypothetical protein
MVLPQTRPVVLIKEARTKQQPLDINTGRAFYVYNAEFIFSSREELTECSTFIATEFARFGLTTHQGIQEPDRERLSMQFQ